MIRYSQVTASQIIAWANNRPAFSCGTDEDSYYSGEDVEEELLGKVPA